jgi:hypothetical protein
MKALIFKTKDGEIYEAYTIDHKNGLVGGYRAFSGICQPNPFRIFKDNEVIFFHLDRGPREGDLAGGEA